MQFRIEHNDDLPRLAWCARIERGSDIVRVECGPWVEGQAGFFAEGAWDGDFAQAGLMDATAVLGSGGVALEDEVVLLPSSHTLERLHVCCERNMCWVSNSFAYLLTALDDAPDLARIDYEAAFLSVLQGYRRARRSVCTATGRRIDLHYHRRIHLDRGLRLRTEEPPRSRPFPDYHTYVENLHATTRRLLENAGDSRRSVTYEPLATVSTGYDSPACAVIARNCGCEEAVTFRSARMELNSADVRDATDHGVDIANQLGLRTYEFERSDYLEDQDNPEAEFIATGNGGDDVVMSVLADTLPRKVFFTGFRGDTIWGLTPQSAADSAQFRTKDPSGASLGEFRLRLGFIHAPLPVLTMHRHADLLRISQSDEMAPWRLGNEYDRPIPRRIVESAGVDRAAFGHEKKAITQPFWVTRENDSMFSSSSLIALSSFCEEAERRNLASVRYRLHRAWAALYLWVVWRGNAVADRLGVRVPLRLPMSLRLLVSGTGYKFHWAVLNVQNRYAKSRLTRVSPAEISTVGASAPGTAGE